MWKNNTIRKILHIKHIYLFVTLNSDLWSIENVYLETC